MSAFSSILLLFFPGRSKNVQTLSCSQQAGYRVQGIAICYALCSRSRQAARARPSSYIRVGLASPRHILEAYLVTSGSMVLFLRNSVFRPFPYARGALACDQSVRATTCRACLGGRRLGLGMDCLGGGLTAGFRCCCLRGMSHSRAFLCLGLDPNLELGMAWRAVVGDRRSNDSSFFGFLLKGWKLLWGVGVCGDLEMQGLVLSPHPPSIRSGHGWLGIPFLAP